MIRLSREIRAEIAEHAKQECPRECCGLLMRVGGDLNYRRCTNIAAEQDQLMMDPRDLVLAYEEGEVLAVVHSHPMLPARATDADRIGCKVSGLPWFIMSYPSLAENWILPEETKEIPLVGRTFAYGALDCYSLSQDFYQRKFGIVMASHRVEHGDEPYWWLKGKNLYALEHWIGWGFVKVIPPFKEGDLHLMTIRSPVPNHIGIQLADGKMLHHLMGRLSERVVYGGYWQKNTQFTVRHKSLI